MDAVEFIKEYYRLCHSYMSCSECIFKQNAPTRGCHDYIQHYPEKSAQIVEKWSHEHPVMTNAMKFEEIFGGKPRIPPSNELICPPPFTWPEGKCTDCVECKKWWGDPYKKPEKKNND